MNKLTRVLCKGWQSRPWAKKVFSNLVFQQPHGLSSSLSGSDISDIRTVSGSDISDIRTVSGSDVSDIRTVSGSDISDIRYCIKTRLWSHFVLPKVSSNQSHTVWSEVAGRSTGLAFHLGSFHLLIRTWPAFLLVANYTKTTVTWTSNSTCTPTS